MNKTKKCSGPCGLVKSLEEFSKNKIGIDGCRYWCRQCVSEYNKEYRENNKEAIAECRKNNKGAMAEYQRNNKEALAKYQKEYRENNKETIARYQRERKKTDIQYKIACNLRSRLSEAIKNKQKTGSAVRDLGCSIKELKQRFESMFHPHLKTGEEMTWENYGEWHIDHIIPLSSFNLENREEFLKACHYTNLQPLWAVDNIRKGNKII